MERSTREKLWGPQASVSEIDEHGGERSALYLQAIAALEARDLGLAWELFMQLRARHPDDPASYVCLGTVALQSEDTARAAEMYRHAMRLDPKSVGAHFGFGSLYHQTGHYREAIQWFESALELRPDLVDLHYNLALTWEKLRDYDSMRRHAAIVVERDPESANGLSARRLLQMNGVARWLRRFVPWL